jgi:hypothetical protein
MSQILCAKTSTLRSACLRLSLVGTLGLATVALGNTGCEDKAIGRPCDVLTDAGISQGVFNSQALECPSRVCIKPIVQQNAQNYPTDPPTGPLCSAPCSQDSDCEGMTGTPCSGKDKADLNAACHRDTKCKSGFVCAIPFVKGAVCCQKLCVCKDFLAPSGLPTPIACQGGAAATCNE